MKKLLVILKKIWRFILSEEFNGQAMIFKLDKELRAEETKRKKK